MKHLRRDFYFGHALVDHAFKILRFVLSLMVKTNFGKIIRFVLDACFCDFGKQRLYFFPFVADIG